MLTVLFFSIDMFTFLITVITCFIRNIQHMSNHVQNLSRFRITHPYRASIYTLENTPVKYCKIFGKNVYIIRGRNLYLPAGHSTICSIFKNVLFNKETGPVRTFKIQMVLRQDTTRFQFYLMSRLTNHFHLM
jgi:hypothetical protein